MKLVKTTYVAGPEDALAVKDVYKEKSSAVFNSYQDAFAKGFEEINKITSMLSSLGGKLNSLTGLSPASLLQGLPGGSIAQTLQQLSNAYSSMGGLSSVVSSINSVSSASGLQSAISGQLGSMLGGDMSSVGRIARSLLASTASNLASSMLSRAGLDTSLVSNLNLDSMVRNLSRGNFDTLSRLRDMPDTVKPSLNFGSRVIKKPATVTIGDTVRQIADQNPDTIKPIADLINSITDGSNHYTVTTSAADAALVASVVHAAENAGIPRSFNTFAESIKDRDTMLSAATPLARHAAQTGNLSTLDSIADTDVASSIKQVVPDVVRMMTSTMQAPKGMPAQDYARHYTAAKETFEKIDPSWTEYKRKDSSAVNAAQIGSNYSFCDLIRAQMNELMSPEGYKSNKQRVGSSSSADSQVDKALSEVIYSSTTDGPNKPVAVDPNSSMLYRKEEMSIGAKGSEKTYDFTVEPYMLLAPMYTEDSVDACLKRDWPEWYSTLGSDAPILPTSY